MTSISDVRKKVLELGSLISAQNSYLIIPEYPTDSTPYIEIINGDFHYVSSERGMEISRRVTNDVDELLYWIFKRIVSAMATEYEFKNRIGSFDSRRISFAKQIELMSKINESWGSKIKQDIDEILKDAPYDDFSDARVEYCKKLMSAGMSGEKAYEQGCKRFPLNVVNSTGNAINSSDASFLKKIWMSVFN